MRIMLFDVRLCLCLTNIKMKFKGFCSLAVAWLNKVLMYLVFPMLSH